MDIPLKNIEMLQFPDDKFGCSFLLCASTRAGKTSMLNHLYDKYFKKHCVAVMSNSLNSDAYDYIKKSYVALSDLYHPEVLKDMYKINHATKNHYKFFCIIDDITDHKSSKEIVKLFSVYRNVRISTCVCAQATSLMNKTARANINFVFLGRLNNDGEIESVIKSYLTSFFPTRLYMAEKISLYRQLTEDYHWICIDMVGNDIFRTKLNPNQVFI
jgi:hypothetical protein